ncbi:MAG: copper chaperone PCu(A)C [Thermoflexales bacterium]|nr:copper chaperone PCu(A)C [Thermoflexales bacterium]
MKLIAGLATALALVACAAPPPAAPAPSGQSNIVVKDAWARPAKAGMMHAGHGDMNKPDTAASGPVSAAYMVIENTGTAADRLIAAEGDVAEKIELHQTKSKDGMMVMEMVQGGIEIPAGGSVVLKPGDYHIMLIGVKQDLSVGKKFTLNLKFQSGKSVPVELTVREP